MQTAVGEPRVGPLTPVGGSRRRRPALVVAALLVALVAGWTLVLRLWCRSDLWLDEAQTVNIARLPLRDIPAALRHDGAPPLYYVLLHGWMRVFGTSNLGARSFSALSSFVCIPLVWVAGRRVGGHEHGRTTAWVATALFLTSPFAVHYATEARMYALVILLTLCGYLALARCLDVTRGDGQGRPAVADLAAVALVSGLLLLTHYWAMFLLVTVGAALAWKAWRAPEATTRTCFAWSTVAVAAGGVLFLPWVPAFLYQSAHTGTPWAVPASFNAMVNAVSEFAGGKSTTGRALGLTFFALVGFGLFGAAIDHHRVEVDLRTRRPARGLAVTVAGTLAVAISVNLVTGGAFNARYASVVFPAFLLLVTLGTTVFADRRVLAGVLAAAALFGAVTATGNVTRPRTQVGLVAAVIRRDLRPGDVVAYCPDQLGPATSRLLPAGTKQYTFPHAGAPQLVDWVDYGDKNRAGDAVAFADLVAAQAGPANNVWVVWGSNYRTLGAKCAQLNDELAAKRGSATVGVVEDDQTYYEHATLYRYPPVGR